MKLAFLLAASTMLAAAPAYAQSTGGVHVAVTGGTLGVGPEVGFRADNFGARANATFFGFGHEVESDGIIYDGDLKLRSYGAMADFYPFGGGFRLSAGARISRNRIELLASPSGETVEIGDEEFDSDDVGDIIGEVEAKKFAPMLTLGWATPAPRGIYFSIDAGAMFQGSPRVSELRTTGTFADPDLQAELDAELQRERAEIEDDIDKYKVYPVLQLALGYRFGGSSQPAYVAPATLPPPPPPAPATQVCPDGSVILATEYCPAPPPPPPPLPAPSGVGERG